MNSSPIIVVKEQNTEMSKTVIVPIHDEPSAASEKTNLTQFTFEWKNLCYQVDLPGKDKKTKPLLEYMNGSVKSGEVLAVMGNYVVHLRKTLTLKRWLWSWKVYSSWSIVWSSCWRTYSRRYNS